MRFPLEIRREVYKSLLSGTHGVMIKPIQQGQQPAQGPIATENRLERVNDTDIGAPWVHWRNGDSVARKLQGMFS